MQAGRQPFVLEWIHFRLGLFAARQIEDAQFIFREAIASLRVRPRLELRAAAVRRRRANEINLLALAGLNAPASQRAGIRRPFQPAISIAFLTVVAELHRFLIRGFRLRPDEHIMVFYERGPLPIG